MKYAAEIFGEMISEGIFNKISITLPEKSIQHCMKEN